MIIRYDGHGWDGVEETQYKNEPGTWMDVSRRVLFSTPESQFESRVFTLLPGGYSSLEKHEHEHCVMVLAGEGTVVLEGDEHAVSAMDMVHVRPWQVHQFKAGPDGLKILCVVDRVRDVPVLLENQSSFEAS